jgi:hypothetical protein
MVETPASQVVLTKNRGDVIDAFFLGHLLCAHVLVVYWRYNWKDALGLETTDSETEDDEQDSTPPQLLSLLCISVFFGIFSLFFWNGYLVIVQYEASKFSLFLSFLQSRYFLLCFLILPN